LHDAVLCSEAGVPSVAIITEPFRRLTTMTAVNLGVPEFPYLVMEHPIWTRDQAWIEAAADSLAEAISLQLIAAR
jgi:hypothetical protein